MRRIKRDCRSLRLNPRICEHGRQHFGAVNAKLLVDAFPSIHHLNVAYCNAKQRRQKAHHVVGGTTALRRGSDAHLQLRAVGLADRVFARCGLAQNIEHQHVPVPGEKSISVEWAHAIHNSAMPHRIVLATLNAKYIHASLGLRYLRANMGRHGGADLDACTVLQEFTIHRAAQDIVDALLNSLGTRQPGGVHIVGFGVYIWNVLPTARVIALLKAQRPDVRVVLGGPEVSHELHDQAIVALADHVITGWGDLSFPQLCRALVHGPQPLMKVIVGQQPPLGDISLPYAQYSDTDLAQRVLYVEASRGCPFKCEFCLSALDKTAWAFDVEAFLTELAALYERGARTFKFVDRTFNLKIDASVQILEFFLARLSQRPAEPLFVHFELVPDHLPDRLKECILRFPAGVLQFEIGIQSLNPSVQKAISRRQDVAKAEANLRWLATHSLAHLHADLIFGLPGETWESFGQGFDTLWSWGPHEIQLGLLKRLRGTPMATKSLPGIAFDPAPPYTVRHTDAVSAMEVQAFSRLARYWDLVANSGRFSLTLPLLLDAPSPFVAFSQFSDWLWRSQQRTSGLTPELLVDLLFEYLCQQRGLPNERVLQALRTDYVGSGARASPQALRGYLPRQASPTASKYASDVPVHTQRQQRHASVVAS